MDAGAVVAVVFGFTVVFGVLVDPESVESASVVTGATVDEVLEVVEEVTVSPARSDSGGNPGTSSVDASGAASATDVEVLASSPSVFDVDVVPSGA